MSERQPLPVAETSSAGRLFPIHQYRNLFLALGVVTLVFGLPLWNLVRFGAQNDLYSHVVLIPFVSLYLIWLKRDQFIKPSKPNRLISVSAFGLAAVILVSYVIAAASGAEMAREDRLAFQIGSWVCIMVGTCAAFLGRHTLKTIGFPLLFLAFMIPFPVWIQHGIELFFQHTSAAAAAAFFKVAGTPFFREATFFQLPGINLEVAPECSGIRSSLALFITSLVAGQLFLRSRGKRIILACVVIPLGIIRNGVRIFVIGQLCVEIGPEMIHSYIHRQGGPLFFALSLVPFSLFLYLLVKSDRSRPRTGVGQSSISTQAAEPVSSAQRLVP